MQRLGLVFEGGGGKGAYQIGVWKAIRDLGIEDNIVAVSGTSVGALNAALFAKGDYYNAEDMWQCITDEKILKTKEYDFFDNGDCFFSQKGLSKMVEQALSGSNYNKRCENCFATCKNVKTSLVHYFDIWPMYDKDYVRKVLLASAAIPVIFETVKIDGEEYVDGGAMGDNTPITPLLRLNLDKIIVIHLSDQKNTSQNYSTEIIEVIPSDSLGSLIDGTLDFSVENARERMALGYEDGMRVLRKLADEICLKAILTKTEKKVRYLNMGNQKNSGERAVINQGKNLGEKTVINQRRNSGEKTVIKQEKNNEMKTVIKQITE